MKIQDQIEKHTFTLARLTMEDMLHHFDLVGMNVDNLYGDFDLSQFTSKSKWQIYEVQK